MSNSFRLFAAVLFSVWLMACANNPNFQPVVMPAVSSPAPTPDLATILNSVTQLRNERTYLVTMKFKKLELNPLANAFENEMKAEHKTLIVGESAYNGYSIGQEVSSKSDVVGMLTGNSGLFTRYVVSVENKESLNQYFYTKQDGTSVEIPAGQYEQLLGQLKNSSKPYLTVPYSGLTVTTIFAKPIDQYTIVEKHPLKRYFFRVKVENSTFTLDVTKWLRNSANAHEIDLEVTRQAYDRPDQLWDPKLNVGSIIWSGHFSSLHGTIEKRWTVDDPNYVEITTKEGLSFVTPSH